MILLSDKLLLIANNPNSFAIWSTSIIRRNLGLCKHSQTYVIQNFQKHCYGSNGIKIKIWQGKIYQTNLYSGVTENNSRGRLKKVISKKNQELRHWRGRRWTQALFIWVVIKIMLLPIKYKFFRSFTSFRIQINFGFLEAFGTR